MQRMPFLSRSLAALALAGWFLALAGCASTPKTEEESVSTLPWNRPQSWEGTGPLGAGFNRN